MKKTTKHDQKKADAAMLEASLKALSHPVRREILGLLKDPRGNFPEQLLSHDLGVCAGQIERRVGLSQSTVSAHLALLQKAGLLVSRKVGQWSFFSRDEMAIRRFVEFLQSDL